MNRALVVALILVTLSLGGYGVYHMTRGIRNKNPGNIRRTADAWAGLAPVQTDPEYFQFTDPIYGIRALGRVLLNYSSRYGLNTVEGIVMRWAPATENPTKAYISAVARRLNVTPVEPLNVRDRLTDLVLAIIWQENGVNPYAPDTVAEGVRLAKA